MAQEWQNKGSDCCSPFSLCLLSWCCPCITYGRINHRLHKNGQLQGFSPCNWDCCAYACLMQVGCNWILQMMNRSEIRRKHNLKGDGCTDCLCACCCTPCDLTQQEKEAEQREKLLGQGGVHVQPIKSESGMVYQQQQPQSPPAPVYHQHQQHAPSPGPHYGQQPQLAYGQQQPAYGQVQQQQYHH